jgi:hypothetical protein
MLSSEQLAVVNKDNRRVFLEGYAGTGKTSAGVSRLTNLISSGIFGENILVLVPQRPLAYPYFNALKDPNLPPGSTVDILTLGGLAQRMISLFWPIISYSAGFSRPGIPPIFLTLETAQYYLAKVVFPLIKNQGYFDTIHLDQNRILSQIIDNLNKATAIGLPYTSIGSRLKSAWVAKNRDLSRPRVYDEAQECAGLFRQFCLEHNLLDFSLQLDIFTNYLWQSLLCKQYLLNRYHHLIYDNIEEDIPIAHDIIRQWLVSFKSALLIFDTGGGYRSFLGSDPDSAYSLKESCGETISFNRSFTIPFEMKSFELALLGAINCRPLPPAAEFAPVFTLTHKRFFPDMYAWIRGEINNLLINEKVSPGEIAILSPFLTDSLRFSLMNALQQGGIPVRSNRPSRSLRDEPATRCLLTFAKIAHPQWQFPLSRFDLRYALMQSIAGMDLLRADILAKITFQNNKFSEKGLGSFDNIIPDTQERISYSLGEKFENIRFWLEEYRKSNAIELDSFLSRFFGEILSQPGFGFHSQVDSASVAARLIESIQKFRSGTADASMLDPNECGKEYILMVEKGVIAAQYLQQTPENWQNDSILLSPAYSFLISNRPVSYQFWLDIGSYSWWQRIAQPLTHPIVLSRRWNEGDIWSDSLELQNNQESLSRLLSGLIYRCRKHIFLFTTGFNERGEEERGPLVQAMQIIQRHIHHEGENGI